MSIGSYCNNPNTSSHFGNCTEIAITPPLALTIEELVADYDTIRLEASDKSLITGILQIHSMNDKLYITDSSLSVIFIFSKQGKYLSKISNQGSGPQEYIRIGSFETDEANNRLLLTDSFSKRLFEYDENGKLLKVIPLSFIPNLIASDKSKRYIHVNSTSKDKNDRKDILNNNIHIINEKGEVTETFLKDATPNRIDIRTACATSYTEDKELLYMPILSNTIFRIHNSEAIPEYSFKNLSGRKTVTAQEKKELYFEYNDNNIEQAEKDGYLISCGSFLSSDSLVFLDLGWNTLLYTYYSKTNNASITINPNNLQGNKGLCEIFSAHPKAIEDDSLYISIPVEQAAYVLPLLPTGNKLRFFFENTNENDNPYIISYQLNTKLFSN